MAKKTQSIENKDKARKAVDLKIAGATWKQIADELDMETESGPRLLVMRYFEKTANKQFEEMHPILLERSEALWRKAWAKLNSIQTNGGSMDDWDKAMRRCIDVLQSLARMSGLGNGPTIQVNVTTPADVKALRDEFLELRGIGNGNVIEGEIVESDDDNEPPGTPVA